ncbi:MAG: M12 family metallo-peptidase [Acidobacteria bacterium]|nr:M12 family metallo-peptidase [Acidobacteriota bacterium]
MSFRKSTIAGLFMLAALVFGWCGDVPLSAVRPQDGIEGLFVGTTPRALRNVTTDPTVVRSRQVTIDFAALADPGVADARMAARPALLLNLFDDASFTAVRDRIDQTENGFTWVGHIPGIEMSTVTLASVDGLVSGSIVMREAVYAIRYVGGGIHEVAQIDQSKFLPELNPIPVTPADAGMTVTQDPGGPVVMGDDGSTIDVLVLYTPAAAVAAGGTTAMATRVNLGISEANTSYINSGIAQRLRLANSQQVNYSENNDLAQDLYAVSNSNGSTALGDSAASLRNTYNADLVMLITSPSAPNACGIAWLMTSVSVNSMAPYGFSVVEQSCISPNYSFAHELGHNMGARHDWYVDAGKTPYTYAHGYVDPPNRFRTVMSYNDVCLDQGFNCTRLLYWSNPSVHSPGANGSAAMGIAGGTKSDCPTGTTSNISCDADDHRVLNSTAFTVANFRSSVRLTPVVTWVAPDPIKYGTALSATQLNATASVPGTFVYTPAAGAVLTAGTQTLSVTFTPTDTTNYTTATTSVTIVVTASGGGGSGGGGFVGPGNGGPATGSVSGTTLTYNGATYLIVNGKVTFPDCTVYIAMTSGLLIPAGMAPGCVPAGGSTPTITWANPASVVAGTVLSTTQLNATATVPGTFVYTPAAGTVLTAGTRTLSTTFTPTDTANYMTATKTVTIVVTASGGGFVGPGNGGPATGSVSGTTLTYNGATYPIVNGKVTFPDCTMYIALNSGILIPAGTASGCTPSGGGGGSGTTPTTPTITWANPASVVAGTTLGATQLNATANVPGTFVYNPPSGTVLTAGTQTLSTTFTPTDTTTYSTATKSVTIVVTASGGSGGSGFVGPSNGGPSTGSVSGTTLTYNGATYSIVNGKVTFPDCTVYIAMTSGMLIPAGTASGCTPAGGGGSGGSGGGGGGFVGPGNGGPATGSVSGTTLTYNGATYPMVNGKVTFPDCTMYIALDSGILIPAGLAPGCTPSDR